MDIQEAIRKYQSDNGKKGGMVNKTKHGPDYFKKISALGVAARKRKKEQLTP